MLDKFALLKKLTQLDFMALDLQLYLNTHPSDAEALELYTEYLECGNTVREEYESNFGPLTAFRSYGQKPDGTAGFAWADCQWPWMADANFDINVEY